MKKTIILVTLNLILSLSAAAQTTNLSKPVSGGVLNGKALSLPKPEYPAAAKAVKASGEVKIQVLIDENGNIESASAISGHPLLRVAAERAARDSKFSPTMLQGQPVKISGIIVYNFAGPAKSSWLKVGYDLASVQKLSSMLLFNTGLTAANFQPEWTTEIELIKQLEAMKQVETNGTSEATIIVEKKVAESAEKTGNSAKVRDTAIETNVKSSEPPSAERIAVARNLISSLQQRLATDPVANWQLNLGITLNSAISNRKNQAELQNSLDLLRQQSTVAPSGISAEYMETVQKLITILETQNPTAEQNSQIGQLLSIMF